MKSAVQPLKLLAFTFAFVSFYYAYAADKSGVTPNTISLPKGPGSIEGLGESFQPTLNTGTAKYNIALKLPPGTAGQTPGLSLSYEGGGANGPLGFGWSLPTANIQRRSDHGIPTYGEFVGFSRSDTFINDMKEELVPLTNGYWFCKNEGVFIRYQQVSNYWVGTLPNGTRMEFGLSADARVQDPANTNHIFSWLLQKETDTHGNVILYSYTNFPGTSNLNQKYLSGIAYGPGGPTWSNFHFVTFTYEDRSDWFEDCRSGFIVRTGKRLKSIVIGTQGPTLANHLQGDFNYDGIPDNLDRRYDLSYSSSYYWSLLAAVQLVGADGLSTLPPSTFGYKISNPADTISAAGRIIFGTNEPPFLMDNQLADLVDLNGDGLPDILKTEQFGGQHTAWLNQGQAGSGTNRAINWSPVTNVGGDSLAQNFNLQSSSDVAHLADMDGDGAADFVYKSAVGDVYYFPNQNNLTWGSRQQMTIGDTTPPSPFGGDPNVRTADLDFDKRMDVIQSIDNGGGSVSYRIWFNLGNQTYAASVTVDQDSGFLLSQSGVQIADFNGDRVPDVVSVRPSSVIVTAGLGYGHFAGAITVPIPDYVFDDTQIPKLKLTDINGDGLADLVLERAAPGELWYWLNLGNYTFSNRKVINDLPAFPDAAAIRWADLNGNGTVDLIYADSSANPGQRLQTIDFGELLNTGLVPNSLIAISNGIGRVTLISYQPSTFYSLLDATAGRPWPDFMPIVVSVVSAVTNLDSLGHSYATSFRYHNAYYDPTEKQFRGFGSAEQVDIGDPSAPTLVTRSQFDTGRIYEAMKGKLLVVSTEEENGAIFWSETNLWTIPPMTLYTGTNGTNVAYAHPTGTVKIISELDQGISKRLETEVAYDNFGNQTTNADYGIVEDGDRKAGADERITTVEYALNTNSWIIRHPIRQETKGLTNAVLSRVESYYDDETFSGNNFGQITVGNLTLRREWVSAASASAHIKAVRTKYDTFGNPATLLDPLAIASGANVDFTKGHAREIAYDPRFHNYPITETIYIGNGSQPLLFQADFDEGLGTVSSAFDFNTNRTTFGYDTFARLSSIVKPYDTTAYPTVEYDYALGVPTGSNGVVNYVETRQLDTDLQLSLPDHRSYYHIARQFVDGLGRKLMTKTEAEPAPGSATPRVVISEATLFNAREKPAGVLNPCFSLIGSATLDDQLAFESIESPGWQGSFELYSNLVSLTLSNAHKSAVVYDSNLREISHINPDGTFTSNRFEPLLVRSFDENQTDLASQYFGSFMVHYNDGLGRLVQVDEVTHLNDDGTTNSTIKTWTTHYDYDLNDQLTKITDSQSNVKTMSYDGLKRKTFMNDLDRGHMTYVYDDASNVSQTADAKGQIITYTYDGANRILTEDYHDEGLPFSANKTYTPSIPISPTNLPDVVYFYDLPSPSLDQGDNTTATARNTRGMLAYVWDLSGEEHTSYDARGRIEYTVKRAPDPVFYPTLQGLNAPANPQFVSYKTAFDFDSMDRTIRLVYPDNDEVTYQYNERGLLKRIPGGPNGNVISNIIYHPSAQQAAIDYGNGIRTTYEHDNRLRLTHLFTFRTLASTNDPQLINFTYDFDPVSNIRQISDNRPGTAVLTGDKRRNTQLFRYDDLYRLTRAQYSFNLPGEAVRDDGVINYRYDRIGNMVSQTSDIQDFDAMGLSVTQLGDMAYGGSAGKSGRAGRSATDPPGPHALSSVSQLSTNSAQPRIYPYDPNGNMLNIDGLACTWDFKDRLVAVENDEMRAEYSYDYTDRRISKRVKKK